MMMKGMISKYNSLMDEFQEFRRTNYNKEVETALDLVGLIDKNLSDGVFSESAKNQFWDFPTFFIVQDV